MLIDVHQIEGRIRMIENSNKSLEREKRFADPILKITARGRRVSSINASIDANKREIEFLRRRLDQVRKAVK